MSIHASLDPLPAGQFSDLHARHLLSRAGFGGTPGQVEVLVDMGLAGAVDYLVDYETIDDSGLPELEVDPDIIALLSIWQRERLARARQEDDRFVQEQFRGMQQHREAEDRLQMARISLWWLARMIATPRPLEEKLVLLWHSHFASSYRNVGDSYMMYQQNELFRRHASDFAALARGIVRDPAMLRFLNNDRNRRQQPNENFARELMELFTLGQGHYSEQDIKQGARALTGYTINDHHFVFRPRLHDDGLKSILGKVGRFSGDDFVDILLEQNQCARFVAGKLFAHFAADLDESAAPPHAGRVIDLLATTIRRHDYQLKPALKRLLMSRYFYSPRIMGSQIKSPVQLLVGTIRSLNTPVRDLEVHVDALARMGQSLFEPPSVAGWPGGQQWINTATLMTRQNLGVYLITGRLPSDHRWQPEQVNYNPSFLMKGLANPSNPQAVVDHLLRQLVPVQVPMPRREHLHRFLYHRKDPHQPQTLVGLLLLLTAMPEYQLC